MERHRRRASGTGPLVPAEDHHREAGLSSIRRALDARPLVGRVDRDDLDYPFQDLLDDLSIPPRKAFGYAGAPSVSGAIMYRQSSRPVGLENDSSLTGTFEVTLTRAVLPYGEEGERADSGGRIQDIGLGVVVDGADPARADVLDLGSAEVRVVDLTGPLVVLGWLYPSGVRSLCRVVEGAGGDGIDRTRAFTFNMALRALQGSGFGPLTRPTILRIGFRDLCRDLDLHETTALRLVLRNGSVARLQLDYESVTLVVRSARSSRDHVLEGALSEAFPGRELFRTVLRQPAGGQGYHVPLPIPRSLSDSRGLLRRLRGGFLDLLGRFEPDRCRSLAELTATFGERDSLRSLRDPADLPSLEPVSLRRAVASSLKDVH